MPIAVKSFSRPYLGPYVIASKYASFKAQFSHAPSREEDFPLPMGYHDVM